jgi:peroxiredoxin family protein
MRRIDAIGITFGVFIAGGALYVLFTVAGLDSTKAGIWSQVIFLMGLLGWVSTYLFRAATQNMSYVQQLKNYEDAVMQKRLEEMSEEELEQLQAEVEQAKQKGLSS